MTKWERELLDTAPYSIKLCLRSQSLAVLKYCQLALFTPSNSVSTETGGCEVKVAHGFNQYCFPNSFH